MARIGWGTETIGGTHKIFVANYELRSDQVENWYVSGILIILQFHEN